MTKKYRIPLERMPMVLNKDQHQQPEPEASQYNGHDEQPEVESDFHDNAENSKARVLERKKKKTEKSLVKCAKLIDKSSRFLFPFFFLVFNVFYWFYFSCD